MTMADGAIWLQRLQQLVNVSPRYLPSRRCLRWTHRRTWSKIQAWALSPQKSWSRVSVGGFLLRMYSYNKTRWSLSVTYGEMKSKVSPRKSFASQLLAPSRVLTGKIWWVRIVTAISRSLTTSYYLAMSRSCHRTLRYFQSDSRLWSRAKYFMPSRSKKT